MSRGLLRQRDFGLVVSAVGISAAGDFLAIVAIIVLVKEMTESGLAVAGVAICLFAPVVLLAGVAGLLADRVETVRLIVITSLAQAAAAVALAFTGDLVWVLVLTALLGAGNAVSQPAEFALVPAVAGEERLAEANGYVETARYAGLIGGPLLGGILVAGGGTALALLVDAATFVFVAAAVGAVRVRRHAIPADDGTHERARDGFTHLRRDGQIAVVVGVTTAGVLLMSMSIPADVFFAEDHLKAGPIGYAALYSAWALGMVAGAIGLARLVPAHWMATGVLLAVVVQGLGKPIGAATLVLPVALAGYLLGGVGHGTRNVLARTLIHARTPDRLRGRVFAAYNAMRNAAELGALGAGGALVAAAGARSTLIIAGLGQAVVGAAGLALLARRPGAPAEPPPLGPPPPPLDPLPAPAPPGAPR